MLFKYFRWFVVFILAEVERVTEFDKGIWFEMNGTECLEFRFLRIKTLTDGFKGISLRLESKS